MASKTDFKGYAHRFDKGGTMVRETITQNACPECGDGTRGIYTQQWRKGDEPARTLYHIFGECPKGHKIERYGFGETPSDDPPAQVLTNPKSVQKLGKGG